MFVRDYGAGSAAGHARVAEEQPSQEDEDEYGDGDQCPEGILEVNLSGMSPEQSEPMRAARQAGLKVRQPFKRAPGGGGGNRFQPVRHLALASVRPSAAIAVESTPRVTAPIPCWMRPSGSVLTVARKAIRPRLVSTPTGASNCKAVRPCLWGVLLVSISWEL